MHTVTQPNPIMAQLILHVLPLSDPRCPYIWMPSRQIDTSGEAIRIHSNGRKFAEREREREGTISDII